MVYCDEDLQELLEEALANADGSPLKILRLINQLLRTCAAMKANSAQERNALQEAALRLLEMQPEQPTRVEEQLRQMMNLLTAEQIAADRYGSVMSGSPVRQTDEAYRKLERENSALKAENEELSRRCGALQESYLQLERELEKTVSGEEVQRLYDRIERQRREIEQLRRQEVEKASPGPSLEHAAQQPADPVRVRSFQLVRLDVTKSSSAPADAEHVLLYGSGVADAYLLYRLPGLRTVEIAREVQGIAGFAFCGCRDLELTFRAPNCRIDPMAFSDTTISRVAAPAGGNVEQFARARALPFIPIC